MLFAVESGDRLGRGVAAECLAVFVGKGPEERVYPFGGSVCRAVSVISIKVVVVFSP